MRKSVCSERELMQSVVDQAKAFGWLVYHTRDSRGCEPGFPDLILIKGKRLLAVEMKRSGQKPTQAQIVWLDAFRSVETVWAGVVDERGLADLYRLLAVKDG